MESNGYSDALIKRRRFALETMMFQIGKPLKKLAFVYKQTTSNELVDYLKPKLQQFVKHNFVVCWHDKEFKTCIKSFSIITVISIVDFVKNYSFEVQNEVQSMHWHSYQINILVHITF